MIIGLTGAIGAGKSTVAHLFESAGFCTVDCDGISHSLDIEPVYIQAVRGAFGDGVILSEHDSIKIDRKILAAIVFSDENARKKLESISHPIIIDIVMQRIEAARSLGLDSVIDAPLLFESGLDAACDITVGVTANKELRLKRAYSRGGLSLDTIEARINAQPSVGFYKEKCDFIIENNGTEAELEEAFGLLLKIITQRR